MSKKDRRYEVETPLIDLKLESISHDKERESLRPGRKNRKSQPFTREVVERLIECLKNY